MNREGWFVTPEVITIQLNKLGWVMLADTSSYLTFTNGYRKITVWKSPDITRIAFAGMLVTAKKLDDKRHLLLMKLERSGVAPISDAKPLFSELELWIMMVLLLAGMAYVAYNF